MRTIILLIILTVFIHAATKDILYFKGSADDYAIDLAHPEKNKIKLPFGSANVQNVVELSGNIYGITRPEYKNRNPLLFKFSLSTNTLAGFTEIKTASKEPCTPAYNLITDGSTIYCAMSDNITNGELLKLKASDDKLDIESLGSPKKDEAIFCIAISDDKKTIYGILNPSNSFFAYNIALKQFTIIKGAEIDTTSQSAADLMHNGKSTHLCKSLISDIKGRIYGSTGMGKIFKYDPLKNSITILESELPYIQFRRATNRVESWVRTTDGTLYGGTSIDGILFKLNPETSIITNLGKPTNAGNIISLINTGSIVYGICGSNPEYSHLFKFETAGGGFEDLGILRFKNTLINARHMSYFLSGMIKLTDGRILLTECDLLPFLIFWKK